jgi:hypothetical protein
VTLIYDAESDKIETLVLGNRLKRANKDNKLAWQCGLVGISKSKAALQMRTGWY